MPTPHINAEQGDFAKVVLMPGDPLRAKWIAENFLIDYKQVNSVRGILGFTGKTKSGKRLSVMASGMGMPSIGIYAHELFSFYGVEAIVRIGTAGSYQKDIKVGDIVLAQSASTDSGWLSTHVMGGGIYSAVSDFELLKNCYDAALHQGKPVRVGTVLSSDQFYPPFGNDWKKWEALNTLCVEMEAYSLFVKAAELGKRAMCILTMSDSFHDKAIMSSKEREQGLASMVEIAIEGVEPFCD